MRLKGHKIDKNKVGRIVKKSDPSIPKPKENDRTDESIINESKEM